MQLISGRTARFALLALLAVSGVSSPVLACTLTVTLPGGILKLSGDGSQISSELADGGTPVTMTILAAGLGSTITVQAPTITQTPPGFNPPGLAAEVAYRGTSTLRLIEQPYVKQTTQVSITPVIGLVTMTLNNRIRNPVGGLASGPYSTQTVVTCS